MLDFAKDRVGVLREKVRKSSGIMHCKSSVIGHNKEYNIHGLVIEWHAQ